MNENTIRLACIPITANSATSETQPQSKLLVFTPSTANNPQTKKTLSELQLISNKHQLRSELFTSSPIKPSHIFTTFSVVDFTMTLRFVFVIIPLLLRPSDCQINFCAKSCPANEVYSSEVSQCHNTCFNRDFNETFRCQTAPGCVCKGGYIRDQETFKCIPVNSCSLQRGLKNCPSNEFYSDCDCFKTCLTRNLAVSCNCRKGCACRTGYVRSDVNFQCVPEASCPS
jgi:hypothetical protein